MSNLTPKEEAMLALWQQHTYAEFVLKDTEAALATMTDNPYVFLGPCGTGGFGKEGVREFYSQHFIPNVPADMEMITISQVFGADQIVEESVIRFTHDIKMDWMLPGIEPTGRKVEFIFIGFIQIEDGKIASERLYWDQSAVLSQLGVLPEPAAAAGSGSAAKLLQITGK